MTETKTFIEWLRIIQLPRRNVVEMFDARTNTITISWKQGDTTFAKQKKNKFGNLNYNDYLCSQ